MAMKNTIAAIAAFLAAQSFAAAMPSDGSAAADVRRVEQMLSGRDASRVHEQQSPARHEHDR